MKDLNKPIPLDSTNSWISPTKNSLAPTSDLRFLKPHTFPFLKKTLNHLELMLIGPLLVSSTPSETKDHADHAGPSQLLVLLKLPMPSPERDLTPSLNKNLLIAQPHMVTLVATVDGWTLPSNTSWLRVSQADLLIPMSEKIKHAKDKTVPTESPNSLTSLQETVVH